MNMPFVIIWIVQMLIFFLFIIGIVLFLSKVVSKNNKEQSRERPIERSYQPIETRRQEDLKERLRRNQSAKSNRGGKSQPSYSERKQQENDTIANRRRRREESVIGSVVKFSPFEEKKKNKTRVPLNKKNLKQAIIYKEILDKPLSIREETIH